MLKIHLRWFAISETTFTQSRIGELSNECIKTLGAYVTRCFTYLSRSANLPEGLYILPMFFLLFLFFLMVDFLAIVAETLIEQSSPKFQDW